MSGKMRFWKNGACLVSTVSHFSLILHEQKITKYLRTPENPLSLLRRIEGGEWGRIEYITGFHSKRVFPTTFSSKATKLDVSSFSEDETSFQHILVKKVFGGKLLFFGGWPCGKTLQLFVYLALRCGLSKQKGHYYKIHFLGPFFRAAFLWPWTRSVFHCLQPWNLQKR